MRCFVAAHLTFLEHLSFPGRSQSSFCVASLWAPVTRSQETDMHLGRAHGAPVEVLCPATQSLVVVMEQNTKESHCWKIWLLLLERGLRNKVLLAAGFQLWARLESGRQQLSCRPSLSLLLRCNFFNEENLLSRNITFLKACPDKAVQADRVASQLQQISVTHYRDFSPPPPSSTPHSQTREWITLLLLNTSWQSWV